MTVHWYSFQMKNIEQLEKELHNRRVLVIIGLLGIAAVHVLDLPGKWTEVRYIAWMYIAVIVAVGIGVERLVVKVSKRDYLAASLLSISVIVGYIVNRTVGMPGAKDDIGNWFEPLGLLSLFIEAFAVWQCLAAYLVIRKLENQNS
jgi:hypothetical protein